MKFLAICCRHPQLQRMLTGLHRDAFIQQMLSGTEALAKQKEEEGVKQGLVAVRWPGDCGSDMGEFAGSMFSLQLLI